jgi:hypothetical protein
MSARALNILTKMSARPGYITSTLFFTGSMIYMFKAGPHIEDPMIRYTIAGTAATLFTELATHAIDTINMKSKAINGPKLYVFDILRIEGPFSLLRGVQPVLYGYFFSSMIYFYIYVHIKALIKKTYFNEEGSSFRLIYATAVASFLGSIAAEYIALGFYYPFDLIKTRMQTSY